MTESPTPRDLKRKFSCANLACSSRFPLPRSFQTFPSKSARLARLKTVLQAIVTLKQPSDLK